MKRRARRLSYYSREKMQTRTPGEQQVDPTLTDEWAWSDAHALPGAVDVAIIGGGIVGCSAAYFLAREGLRVALFEKGRIAGEQSGRNWGWVRQQGRSPIELPLMMRSLRLWLELREELGDIGFRQGGSLYLARDDAELAELERWLSVAREHDLDTQLLDSQKLAAVLRTDDRRWSGALHTASDARAEPSRATPAIARAAQRRGAQIFSHCAVRGIDRAAGRIQGVMTERGRVAASTVVCAGGAWTSSFCRFDRHHLPAIDRARHSRAHRADSRNPRRRSVVSCHRDPPSGGRRLLGRARRLFPAFTDPEHAAVRPQVLAGLRSGSPFDPGSPRRDVLRGSAHARELGDGRGFALRAPADAAPGARKRTSCASCGQPWSAGFRKSLRRPSWRPGVA